MSVSALRSLTGDQERWLRAAIEAGDEGAYIPITSGLEPYQLVDGACATLREARQASKPSEPWARRYEWTDTYLVATDYGKRLLTARGERSPGLEVDEASP